MAIDTYSDGLREAERWDPLVGITRTHADCAYFDSKEGLCNNSENRFTLWGLKWFRRKCRIAPGHEQSCHFFKQRPSYKASFGDPSVHGQCVDMAGNEWEVTAVTSDDIVISVRSTNGRSCQTRIPKEPFLSRLADSTIVESDE